MKTGDIVNRVHDSTGACSRTVKTRLREAVESGYLKTGDQRGLYPMGPKRLPK